MSHDTPIVVVCRRPLLPSIFNAGCFLLCGCSTTEVDPTYAPHHEVAVLEDINPDPDIVEVNLVATHDNDWDFGDGLTSHTLAYNGLNPGPLLEAELGDRIIVHFRNDLAAPTTVHWHGLRVPDAMDGTLMVQNPVEPGSSFDYEFVARDVGLYWYHPHMHESAQIDLGLYGTIIIHDPDEPRSDALALDQPLVIDDVLRDETGQILGIDPHSPDLHDSYPDTVDDGGERLGGSMLVNGRIGPSIPVTTGSWVLFRLLNTSNARTLNVHLEGHAMHVVGYDGGFLPEPYQTDSVRIGVAERYLVLVEMTGEPGDRYSFINDKEDEGAWDDPMPDGALSIATIVYGAERVPRSTMPFFPANDVPDMGSTTDVTYTWKMYDQFVNGGFRPSFNGRVWPDVDLLTYPGDGDYTFFLVNDDESKHPFHLHGNRFQVVQFNGQDVDMHGWKDTVLVDPDDTALIRTQLDNVGRWMYHCHILAHQEEGMMGELIVE